MKVGFGYDLHPLVEGRPLILGGVRIPFDRGLLGHSDGDVVCHAIADALLGAMGLGDIGEHFPDTDPKYKNANSMDLLSQVVKKIQHAGFQVSHVDVTIVAESPKLSPYKFHIAQNLAPCLGVSLQHVSIKAKTNEKMDAVGRGEAIVVYAVALLEKMTEMA